MLYLITLMRTLVTGCALFLLSVLSAPAQAQSDTIPPMDHSHHMAAMAAMASDTRQLLDFPAPMKAHMLGNMRGHLQSISAILAAMADNQFSQAASIATDNLGLESPGAQGCTPASAQAQPGASDPMDMQHMMGRFMPPEMRTLAYAMHSAASDFASAAQAAGAGGDTRAALGALSHLAQQCVACHAAYRLN